VPAGAFSKEGECDDACEKRNQDDGGEAPGICKWRGIGFAGENESGPVERVIGRFGADHLQLGRSQGVGQGARRPEVEVKTLHEQRGRFVVDGPEAHDHGRCAGIEKGPGQALDALAPDKATQTGLAGRKNDQFGVHPQIEDLPHLKKAVFGGVGSMVRTMEERPGLLSSMTPWAAK
jgi:hypothetical protein